MAPKSAAASVDALLAARAHPLGAELQALRRIILEADERIRESVKWNAPSYAIEEHFATFNLRRDDRLQIILHTGAKKRAEKLAVRIDEPALTLEWLDSDRALLELRSMDEITKSREAILNVLRQWIAQVA
jgi:hypothetical protein